MLSRFAPTLYDVCMHWRRGLEGHKWKITKCQSCVELNWQLMSVLFFICELMCGLICCFLKRFLGELLSARVLLLLTPEILPKSVSDWQCFICRNDSKNLKMGDTGHSIYNNRRLWWSLLICRAVELRLLCLECTLWFHSVYLCSSWQICSLVDWSLNVQHLFIPRVTEQLLYGTALCSCRLAALGWFVVLLLKCHS